MALWGLLAQLAQRVHKDLTVELDQQVRKGQKAQQALKAHRAQKEPLGHLAHQVHQERAVSVRKP